MCSYRENLLLKSQTAQFHIAKENFKKTSKAFTDEKGLINSFKAVLNEAIETEYVRNEAQKKASQCVFQEVWQKAKQVIESRKPERCPVCQTPWGKTTAGSVDNVLVLLNDSLNTLRQFRVADNAYTQQHQHLTAVIQKIESSLNQVIELSHQLSLKQIVERATELRDFCRQLKEVTNIKEADSQYSRFIADSTIFFSQLIPEALSKKELESSKKTSISPIDQSIARLQGLKETILRLEALEQQKIAIKTVEKKFNKVADTIRQEIKILTETAVDALRYDVEKIYKQIHPGEAVPKVFIELDTEKNSCSEG